MRATRIILLSFTLGFVVISVCSAQFNPSLSEVLNNLDVNLVGAGARAEGLGGAFIGVADDATSILWNPAGLATLERPEASVVVRSISQKAKYSAASSYDNNTQNVSQFALNFGSVAYPLRSGGQNIVLALAYQQQINLRKVYLASGGAVSYQNTGGVNTISPGIGAQLTSFMSVGVAANLWLGRLDQSDRNYWQQFDTSSYSATWVETNTSSSGTFSGTNFVLGLLLDFSGTKAQLPLKLGISLKTPFNLKQKYSETYSDAFYGGSSWDGEQTIQMPLMLGLGISYRIGDNLTVAADYEMRQFKDKTTDYSFSGSFSSFFPRSANVTEGNQNLDQVRIGAEYLLVTNFGVFPVRAGYRTVPTVLANQNPTFDFSTFTYDPGYSGEVVGKAVSFGTGYIGDHFALDMAYTSTSYTQSLSYTTGIYFTTGVYSASLIFYF